MSKKSKKQQRQKRKVIVMRGASGSGKSTYVKKHFPGAEICSADQFFIDSKTGEYEFNPKMLGAAHGECKRNFKNSLRSKVPLVVVDNTNTMLKELQPYIMAAQAANYEIEVIRLEVPLDVAAQRNVHGVPYDAVKRMKGRMVDYPGEKIISGTD